MKTINTYLLKALEAYPYDIAGTVESLNYALSYEPENAHALSLMAQVYHEQLHEYEEARTYYEAALSNRLDLPHIYAKYIHLLLHADDFTEAQKVIDYAISVKGVDKAGIMVAQGQLYESLEQFEKAREALLEAKFLALNSGFMEWIDGELARIKKKKQYVQNRKKSEAKEQRVAPRPVKQKSWFVNRLNNLL